MKCTHFELLGKLLESLKVITIWIALGQQRQFSCREGYWGQIKALNSLASLMAVIWILTYGAVFIGQARDSNPNSIHPLLYGFKR